MIIKKKRSITKKTIIYTGGTILASVTMPLSTYLYSKYTTPANFGDFQLTLSLVMLLVTVGFLDIKTSTLRFMYGVGDENDEDRNKAIYGGSLVQLLCTIFLFLAIFITSKITHCPFPKAGLLWGICFALGNFYLFVARGFDKELEYSIGYTIYFFFLLIFNLFFLTYKKFGAEFILISMGLGNLSQAIYLELKIGVIKNFKKKYIDKTIITHMLRFSFPLAITALGTWIMSYYASIKINSLLNSSANGIFSMSMDFARSIPMVSNGIILAWQEIAFSRESKLEDNKEYFSKSISGFFLIFTCIFIVFVPLMKLIIPYFLSPSFQSVGIFLALCTAGYTFDSIGQMVACIFGNDIDSKPIMISTAIGSIFLIVSLPILIRNYQLLGAAIACCSAFAITLFIRIFWLVISKKFRINFLSIISLMLLSSLFGYYCTISSYKVNTILLVISLSISIPLLIIFKKRMKS